MIITETQARDVSIRTADGLTLAGRHWARPSPRGVVVLAHGFGEHGGAYAHVAAVVGPAADVDLLAFDFRGHGRSPGRRGVVGRYDDLLVDLNAALDWAGHALPGLPRFVLAHSNGGLVALCAVLRPEIEAKVTGLVVVNPMIKLSARVPYFKIAIGRFLLRTRLGITLPAPLAPETMTSDPIMQRIRHDDPLRHGRMSPQLYFGMIDAGAEVAARAEEIVLPLLLILGGADPVVDPVETRAVFERFRSTDKTLMLYPKLLHEPLNELGREKVIADSIAWLDSRLPAAG
jgi:alpha-beta hydrolase superfamily lysophospholipase